MARAAPRVRVRATGPQSLRLRARVGSPRGARCLKPLHGGASTRQGQAAEHCTSRPRSATPIRPLQAAERRGQRCQSSPGGRALPPAGGLCGAPGPDPGGRPSAGAPTRTVAHQGVRVSDGSCHRSRPNGTSSGTGTPSTKVLSTKSSSRPISRGQFPARRAVTGIRPVGRHSLRSSTVLPGQPGCPTSAGTR